MVVDIWLQLAATLNFTFTLGLSSDRKWGAKNQVEFVFAFFALVAYLLLLRGFVAFFNLSILFLASHMEYALHSRRI